MMEWARKRRNNNELKLLHPAWRGTFERLVRRMEEHGFRPRLQDTWRTMAEQKKHYAAGRSLIKMSGPHTNQTPDGPASLATHVLNDNNPLGEVHDFWAALAIESYILGLESGMFWGADPEQRKALQSAQETARFNELARLLEKQRGWDPNHVEVWQWRDWMGVWRPDQLGPRAIRPIGEARWT